MAYTKLHALLVAVISLLLVSIAPVANAIATVEVVGSKFFTSAGNQWYIKGIAYQLIEDDPLVDVEQCTLDANLMKTLGANAIRVYHVDSTADHSGCMKVFADAGIYLFVDLDSFKTYIRYGTTPSWTQTKFESYAAVMDNFQQYDNTAGFFVGNEVLNNQIDSGSAPYLLAAIADLRTYRTSKGYRNIPIGYSATDTDELPMLQDYLVCRPNVTERVEFYALNSYRWCDPSTYTESGYDKLEAAAVGYPVPIWFSETGCNTHRPRTFSDQAAVFGTDMVNTWSGSIIYEWIQETNAFGLISYGPPVASDVQVGSSVVQGFTRQGTPTPIAPDFTNLQSQWATLKPTGLGTQAAMSTISRTCPAASGNWTVDPSAALPTRALSDPASSTTGPITSMSASTTAVSTHTTSQTSSSASVQSSTSGAVGLTGHSLLTTLFVAIVSSMLVVCCFW